MCPDWCPDLSNIPSNPHIHVYLWVRISVMYLSQFSHMLYIEGTITSAKNVGVVELCGGEVFHKLCQALFSSVLNLR